jgi:F0F1-type ATP synthase membrane subunit c/vacuolar-type H+-ATPase subunit K
MHIDFPVLERTIAIVGGIVVGAVSAKALKDDWKTPGIENHVFKIMLGLLCLGAIIAILAGAHVLGNFPDGA